MEEALLHFKYDPHSLPRLQREQLYTKVFYHWCLAVVLKKKKKGYLNFGLQDTAMGHCLVWVRMGCSSCTIDVIESHCI